MTDLLSLGDGASLRCDRTTVCVLDRGHRGPCQRPGGVRVVTTTDQRDGASLRSGFGEARAVGERSSESQSETSVGRDMEPLADRPGYNAKPTDWVRYANHLEAELQRFRDDEDSAGAECGRLEADIYGLHAGLEDVGLPGAINAESIEERIGRLVDVREAAVWVVLAWDNEQTQHLSMPALREALGWPRERPSLEEARRRLNAKCGIAEATKQGEPAQRSEPHQRKDDPRKGQGRGGESRGWVD